MKIVRVQYTVKPEFVAQNRANIEAVMSDLKRNPIEGMRYSCFLLPDGGSFMHLNIARDQTAIDELTGREPFKEFQKQLKASGPVSPPKPEDLTLVGAGIEML